MTVIRRDKLAPRDRSGHLYYVRLNTPIGVLYKLGYTKLGSVEERLAFKGLGEQKMIDQVLCFVYLPDAYDVERLLHGNFSSQLAFGKFSAIEEMPLFRNGQSELYCEDVLEFDDEFSKDGAKLAMEKATLARYTKIWGSEEKARQMIRSHNVVDQIGKVLGTVLFWALVFPIAWVVKKFSKNDRNNDPSRKHYEQYNARVSATIERLRQAEAERRTSTPN